MSIKDVIQLYSIGEILDVEKINLGFSNKNYKLTTSSDQFLYRIYKSQPKEHVEYEMNVLKVFKDLKIPAALPVQRKDGSYMTNSPEGVIVVFEFMQGPATEINEHVVREIARVMGKIHKIPYQSKGIGYRKNSISLERCQRLIERFDSAPCQYPDIFEYFIDQTNFLRMPMQISVPRGLVHGDLFPTNTIFKGGKLQAILNFEEVCVDSFLFDIGMTINGFCFEGNVLNEQLTAVLLEEYYQQRTISKQEVKLLPTYVSWAAHGMLAWHLENNLLNEENPKQLQKVEELMIRVRALRNTQLVIARM